MKRENVEMLKADLKKQIAANRTRIEQEESSKLSNSNSPMRQSKFSERLQGKVNARMSEVSVRLEKEQFKEYGGSVKSADKVVELDESKKLQKDFNKQNDEERKKLETKARLKKQFKENKKDLSIQR